jgi:hypothetical protein
MAVAAHAEVCKMPKERVLVGVSSWCPVCREDQVSEVMTP